MGSIDFTWLIGGPQGSGVDSGANVFSKVCAEMGYGVLVRGNFILTLREIIVILQLEFLMKKFIQM